MGAIEFSDDKIKVFNEAIMNQTLSKEGLSQYFANSFLVEIRFSDMYHPTDDIDFVKMCDFFDKEDKEKTVHWSYIDTLFNK